MVPEAAAAVAASVAEEERPPQPDPQKGKGDRQARPKLQWPVCIRQGSWNAGQPRQSCSGSHSSIKAWHGFRVDFGREIGCQSGKISVVAKREKRCNSHCLSAWVKSDLVHRCSCPSTVGLVDASEEQCRARRRMFKLAVSADLQAQASSAQSPSGNIF